MNTGIFIGIAVVFLVFAWSFICVYVGFAMCISDVEDRLSGRLPIDEFWRKRGMKP